MSASPSLAPETGTVVGEGRFALHEVLGEGGVARVYRADDRELGRSVALKLLIERYKGRPEREQRLLNEVAFLRRIGPSPHVVGLIVGGRLRDCGGWPYVATDLLEGRTLAQHRLTARSISVQQVCLLARQIAQGVLACHRAGVVHRDLTPGNLMLLGDPDSESCRVKLFDFSHAAWIDGSKEPVGHPERFTRELEVPGTPKYMAPEQAGVEPASPAMDVYALGVVLWELITGENPFGRIHDRQEFIDLQRRGVLETPRMMAWTYQIPEPLAAITNDCLDREPKRRPTMDVIVQQLEQLRGEPPTETTATISIPLKEIERAQRSAAPSLSTDEEEATERREVQLPQRPAFAREHAALVAPPIVAPRSEAPSEPELREDPGPLNRRSRFLPLLLVGVLLAGLAAWLMLREGSDNEDGLPETIDPVDGSGELGEAVIDPLPAASVPDPKTDRIESPEPEESKLPQQPEPPVEPEPKPALTDPPRHLTPECAKVRDDANAAITENKWDRAEQLTRSSKCWSNPTERLRLRVEALAQAERYPECVRAGKGSSDKEIKRWVKFCQSAKP